MKNDRLLHLIMHKDLKIWTKINWFEYPIKGLGCLRICAKTLSNIYEQIINCLKIDYHIYFSYLSILIYKTQSIYSTLSIFQSFIFLTSSN